MIDLFLPYVIALVLGIEPAQAPQDGPPLAVMVPAEEGSGDGLDASRPPEAQIATGKFTTALEVRPILGMTKAQWVGVREFNGQDYIYFTQLMAWRCGLWDIRYGINGEAATNVVAMEPCNKDFAQPNVMLDVENFLPYVVYPLGSVDTITVEIVYDDGTEDAATYERNAVRIP